jgi:hypothetical protein
LKALPFLFSLLQLNHLSKGYGFRGQGQLIGFVFWYRGLAQGGIAAVAQLEPKNGSWMRPPVLRSACQTSRDDAAGCCPQEGATPYGAPSAVLAGA